MVRSIVILSTLVFILFLNHFALPLDVYGIRLPRNRGMKTCLSCLYYLDSNDTLNAVNWYRNNELFYSFYANDVNPLKWVHREFDDFRLDLDKTDDRSLCMSNISPSAGGYYKCEITTKGERFEMISVEALLNNLMPTRKLRKNRH